MFSSFGLVVIDSTGQARDIDTGRTSPQMKSTAQAALVGGEVGLAFGAVVATGGGTCMIPDDTEENAPPNDPPAGMITVATRFDFD